MTDFKIGDKVKIVRRVPATPFHWAGSMDDYVNDSKVYTIKEFDTHRQTVSARLTEDCSNWLWPLEAFELVEEKIESEFKIKLVFKVEDMEFDTEAEARDHIRRLTISKLVKTVAVDENGNLVPFDLVGFIVDNKEKFINILK